MSRTIHQTYQDPLDIIWIHAARECGIEITRDPEVFASWDGRRHLRLGTPETLDADDSLAQMILHELCHALVAGEQGQSQPDWGLDYDNPDHQVFEHATLRLQAALAAPFGLRSFMASTTDYREYFDLLPEKPLEGNGDPASPIAQQAFACLQESDWHQPIQNALSSTRLIRDQVRDLVDGKSIWH